MELNQLHEQIERAKQRDPSLFRLPSERPATNKAIEEAEGELNTRFPLKFAQFLQIYGGGDFGRATIYHLNPDGLYFLVSQNRKFGYLPGFLAVSDDGFGDAYGFKVDDGTATDEVWKHDHETGEVVPTEYSDFFEFLVSEAFDMD